VSLRVAKSRIVTTRRVMRLMNIISILDREFVTQSLKFVKIRELLTYFKIRKNSQKFVESACLCGANCIWAFAILDECSSADT